MIISYFKKSVVLVIIFLFFGACVLPVIGENIGKVNNRSPSKEVEMSSVIDWPSWKWAKKAGADNDDLGFDISVDPIGNIYVTGIFRYTVSFGDTILSSNGYEDIFVAKMDSNGNWLWAISAGGINHDVGNDICIDSNGFIYITGYFESWASFGSNHLQSKGYEDVFVAKIDGNGNWVWVKQAGGEYTDISNGICIDLNGYIYITGNFNDSVWFGNTLLECEGNEDLFVTKLDNSGNWLWAISSKEINYESGYSICVDFNGNIYVTGYWYGWIPYDSSLVTINGNLNVFVAKLDNSGNWLWVVFGGGISTDWGYGIGIDSNQNIYITGFITDIAKFGNDLLTSNGKEDIFVAKLDNSGNWLWVKNVGGILDDEGIDIYIDFNNNIYITGYFFGTATFGDTVLTSYMYTDIFVAKINSNGNWLWAISAKGTLHDGGIGIFVNSNGIYITGGFKGISFFGKTVLTSAGSWDVFVAKMSHYSENDRPLEPLINGTTHGRPGESYHYYFHSIDPDDDYIRYIIDWGDGNIETTDYYESGLEVNGSHIWDSKGTYNIKIKAEDTYDLVGPETTLKINIPRTKVISNSILQSFLQNHINLLSFLQKTLN